MLSRGRSFRIDQTILNGIKQRREQTFQPLFGEQGPVSCRLTPLPFLISSVHSNLPRRASLGQPLRASAMSTSMPAPSHIAAALRLPDDCWTRILEYCEYDYGELKEVMRVCKKIQRSVKVSCFSLL